MAKMEGMIGCYPLRNKGITLLRIFIWDAASKGRRDWLSVPSAFTAGLASKAVLALSSPRTPRSLPSSQTMKCGNKSTYVSPRNPSLPHLEFQALDRPCSRSGTAEPQCFLLRFRSADEDRKRISCCLRQSKSQ